MRAFDDAELIVCDNNSTDRTAEIARAAGATVVFEPINQIARARNRGAAAATGDWLIFVDADSYPTRELLEEVRKAILSGALAGGAVVHLLRRRGVPRNRRLRPGPLRRRGDLSLEEAQAPRAPQAPPGRHPARPSAAHQRPQGPPLHHRRAPPLHAEGAVPGPAR